MPSGSPAAAAQGAGQPPGTLNTPPELRSGQLAIFLGVLVLLAALAVVMVRRGFLPRQILRFHSAPPPAAALDGPSQRLALPRATADSGPGAPASGRAEGVGVE